MIYFVVSDIHSFAEELKDSLRRAGFNKRNKDHTLIVVGDVFDRGPDTWGVYNYIMSIPKKRRILVRGNHETLFLDLLKKEFPDSYDYSNHTTDTFCQIAGYSPEVLDPYEYYHLKEEDPFSRIREAWKEIVKEVKESPITKWLQSDEWKNYYELDDKYIFVHSFIPLKNLDGLPGVYIHHRNFEYFPEWRTEATEQEWDDATWGCPWKNFLGGYFKEEAEKGRVLVCGHWVVTDFRENLENNYDSSDTSIYFSEHLIGIDCGVWRYPGIKEYIHPQNVLVIKDGVCYDENGDELKASEVRRIETVSEEDIEYSEID